MSQMTMISIAGFADVDDDTLDATFVFTDDAAAKLSHNAEFAAVRIETIFMGFYKHGDTVGTPISPVDGYPYSRSEIQYDFTWTSTRAPAIGFLSGQALLPVIAAGQPSNFYWKTADIDDSTGIVSLQVSYFVQTVSETITHDGIVKVYAVCQRQSVNNAS